MPQQHLIHTLFTRNTAQQAGSAGITEPKQGRIRLPQLAGPTADVPAAAVQSVLNSAEFPDSVKHPRLLFMRAQNPMAKKVVDNILS